MRLTELDYYAALDVPPDAPLEQIETAYLLAIESYSADSLATYGLMDEAERVEIELFLNEAMRVLGNEHLRAQYDKALRERSPSAKEPARRPAAAVNHPEAHDLDTQLPVLPPRTTPAPQAPAPVAADSTPPAPLAQPDAAPADSKLGRDRSWWPFTEKDKAAENAPLAPDPVEPAPPPAPSRAVGEDTAPLGRPAAPAAITALDGRPIGGGELRQIREARGLKLEEISNRTKISMSTLRAIEDSTFKFLPAPVYLKGFLRTYSKMLQIDADKVVADYMRNFEAHKQG